MNKKIPVLIMVIGVLLLIPSTAFGHKLIPTNGSNDSLENGLMISDHMISWAVYEELNGNELYYTFDGKKGDMFFASIVIPKIETLTFNLAFSSSTSSTIPLKDENGPSETLTSSPTS